jgi:uncharacterized protein (TIGR02118 family)
MFKVIVLLKRKHGMTVEEFREYYEKKHVELITANVPMRKYVRNYITPIGNENYAVGAEPQFDCVTEAWFDSEDHFSKAVAAILEPKKAAEIMADEERFADRSAIRWFSVTERETEYDGRIP